MYMNLSSSYARALFASYLHSLSQRKQKRLICKRKRYSKVARVRERHLFSTKKIELARFLLVMKDTPTHKLQ